MLNSHEVLFRTWISPKLTPANYSAMLLDDPNPGFRTDHVVNMLARIVAGRGKPRTIKIENGSNSFPR